MTPSYFARKLAAKNEAHNNLCCGSPGLIVRSIGNAVVQTNEARFLARSLCASASCLGSGLADIVLIATAAGLTNICADESRQKQQGRRNPKQQNNRPRSHRIILGGDFDRNEV